MKKTGSIIIAALLVCSCTLYDTVTKGEKVAQIGGAALYNSDIAKIIPAGTASADSAKIVRRYIDSWALRQLMLQKAEEQLPKQDKDVAQLLEDYRTQLLVFRYETKFVEERLDTLVSHEECEAYYHLHPDSFRGKDGVFKGRLVKMLNSSPNIQKIRKLAKSRKIEDLEELEEIGKSSAYRYSDYNNAWVSLSIVAKETGAPLQEVQKELSGWNVLQAEIKDTVYTNILQVLEYVKPGEVTPLEYNLEKIKEVIISKRKQELLNNLHGDILKDALENNKLKITENEKVSL